MDLEKGLILMVCGLIAGFINVVAGGGSLLTLPVFIFLGFDSNVANATNRVAIFFQNLAAVYGFKGKGISNIKYGLALGFVALLGAIIGTHLAITVDDEMFNRILAIIMLSVCVIIIFNPFKQKDIMTELLSSKRIGVALVTFFFIGIYGGFIQAGVGFLIMAALVVIHRMNLVKVNSIKVVVVLTFTVMALGIFVFNGLVRWEYGFSLAMGQATGGYIGSHWSVKKGDVWIRRVLLVMIIVMALKLLGVPFLNP